MSKSTLARFRARRTMDLFRATLTGDPCHGDPLTAAASDDDLVIHGPAFLFEEMTGDGRIADAGSVEWDLESEAVPIIWDQADGDHTGGIVGVLDQVAEVDNELRTVARLFTFENRDQLVNMIENNAIGWSVGLDSVEATTEYREPEVEETKDGAIRVRITREMQVERMHHGRFRHLALVDTPAHAKARPRMGLPPKDYMLTDVEPVAAAAAVATYPPSHFERWESKDPTPLQVTKDGHVFGHIAGAGCRVDDAATCSKYKRDPDPELRHFHTWSLTTDDGEVIRVGPLVAGTLHASRDMSLNAARQHHENTSKVWALVRAYEDSRGRLCVSGSVIPGLDPTFQAQAVSAPISVEKWPVPGVHGTTLTAAVSVNVPAWPVLSK